jgi:peptidyl-prolyl cis-trans isomerase D
MSEEKQKTFREKLLGWGAKVLLALLILSFGVWGIGDYVAPKQGNDVIATVGNAEITAIEFQNELRIQINRLQGIFGNNFSNQDAKAMGVTENVLQSLIQRNLFSAGAKSMGIFVNNELVSREIRDDDRFKLADGSFDRLKFNDTLQRAGLSENGYIALIKDQLLQNQFLSGISSGQAVPNVLANSIYRHRNEKRLAEFIEIKHSSIKTIPNPSIGTLKTFYTNNAPQFTAPEFRSVTLVQLQIKDIINEISVPETEIKEYYKEHIDEFKTPETRKIQQILVSEEQKANKIYAKIIAGNDFAQSAKEIGGIEPKSLNLGNLTRVQIPIPELAEAAFKLNKNKVSSPIRSALGWHILRVTNIQPKEQKKLSEISVDLRKTLASERAIDILYNLSNKFEDELGGGASIEEAAKRLNFKISKIPTMSAEGFDDSGQIISNINPNIVNVAFGTEQDQDSALTDYGDSGYFILHVNNIIAPAVIPFKKVSLEVKRAWKSDQQVQATSNKVRAIVDRLKNTTSLDDIAAELKIKIQKTNEFIRTGKGLKVTLPGNLITELFKINVKESAIAISNNSHFIAQVKGIKAADPIADKKGFESLSKQLKDNISNDITTQFANALRLKLGVKINRNTLNSSL